MQKRLTGISWAQPPRRDQVEVCVIGPGFGECTLIHIGGGQWVIVDLCIDAISGDPAAITYLTSIGYHPADCVHLMITTHWHDDHIRGISELLRRCPNAKFCCSSAFRRDEFQAMLEAVNGLPSPVSGSGLREIYEVMKLLRDRGQPVLRASPNRPVKSFYPATTAHGFPAVVTTLSPSDRQVDLSFRELTPDILGSSYRIRPVGPNHLTVATLIEIGDTAILLGGDLEETADPQTGWSAIVDSEERPVRKAHIFKIPHHGSANAHCEAVWTELLHPLPHSVLTPFNRGTKLPTAADVVRIVSKTDSAYSTATTDIPRSAKRRSPAVENQLRTMNIKLRRAEPRTGAVRFRGFPNSPKSQWEIELRDDAYKLS